VPWNELDLRDERGDHEDDFDDLPSRYALLGGFLFSAIALLRQRLPGSRIHFPAFTPDHDALLYFDLWASAAELADVVDFHAYDSLDNIRAQYEAYRAAFPTQPLALTEWHCKGDLDEERRVLTWLADTMAADPLFDAAYFFIWRWWDHPGWWSDAWDIEHNPDRYALFRSPPVAVQPAPEPAPPVEPPMPEPEPMLSTPDPWEFWTAEQIAAATGCDVEHIRDQWPRLVAQLALCGIADRPVQVAMIGTVAIESASTFMPVREAFYLGEPEPAESYRKTLWYYPWYGRGHIQCSTQGNYRIADEWISRIWTPGGSTGVDPVENPDALLDPDYSAAFAATYFLNHGGDGAALIPQAARAGDWAEVRRLVQGGNAGLSRLVQIASALGEQPAAIPATLTYNPDQLPERQIQDWVCSIRATTWALKSVGVPVESGAMQDDMVGHGEVNPEQGLLSIYGVRDALARHLPADAGVRVLEVATWDDLAALAGRGPLVIDSVRLYHVLNVARQIGPDLFSSPNPAPGYPAGSPIGDELNRAEFDRWAPWSAVFVEVIPAVQPAPAPHPEPSPAELASLVGVLTHEDGTVVPALAAAIQAQDWGQVVGRGSSS
jgi:hypothetical protein